MSSPWRGVLTAVGAIGLLVTIGPAASRAATTSATHDDVTLTAAPACPAATHPGAGSTQPYQLAFTGTLSGKLHITRSPVGAITLPPIAGVFCGRLELPLQQAAVAAHNLTLTPISVKIARATVPVDVGGTGVTVGTISTVVTADDGLNLTLAAPVAATTGLFGVSCALPVDLSLSTAAPGGAPLVGPLRAARATLAQSGFTIQPAVSTGTAGTCPSYLAAQVDKLLDLPNSATSSVVQVSLDVTVP